MGADGRVPEWSYDDSVIDIGAGMRPQLVGQGKGVHFLLQALTFAETTTARRALRATIALWNGHALSAARRNGFIRIGSFGGQAHVAYTVLGRRASRL